MANTNDELAALSKFLKPFLPNTAKVTLQNWPASPVKQTLVIRSLPDETSVIATGMTRTIRSYQLLYVDDRIDTAQAVVDAMKLNLANVLTLPVNPQTLAFMRISEVAGGKPFKTEGSAPLDGTYFTIRCTSHTARSGDVYTDIQRASVGLK